MPDVQPKAFVSFVLQPLDPLHPTEILPPVIREKPRDRLRILGQDEALEYKRAKVFGFSPSQIDNFRDCNRWWGFRSIEYAPEPSKFSSSLGTECHSHWENYLSNGTIPPDTLAGKIARSTLRFLPLPGVATVEGETKLWTPLGIFTTRIDFTIADQGAHALAALGEGHPTWDQSLNLEGVPLIGDHKTTSNIDDYAKHPEDLIGDGSPDLPGDAQGTGYALVAHVKNNFAPEVDLFWSYAQTKGAKKANPVRARHTLTTLDRSLTYFWQDVARMRYYKETTKNANDLPPNPLSCDKFGGCPHRARCALTNEQRNDAHMTGNLAALLGIDSAPATPHAILGGVVPQTSTAAPLSSVNVLGGLLGSAPAPVAAPAPTPPPAAPLNLLGSPPVVASAPAAEAPDDLKEQCARLAFKLFEAGREPNANAHAFVLEAYAAIVAKAKVNPPDASPPTGPIPGLTLPTEPVKASPVPTPEVAAAPAAPLAGLLDSTPTVVDGAPATTEEKPKKTRKTKTAGTTEANDLAAFGSLDLLQEVLTRNVEAKNFAFVAKLSYLMAENAPQ